VHCHLKPTREQETFQKHIIKTQGEARIGKELSKD
jgi:hypothetical protein